MMKSAEFDADRLALFPSLDYKGLYTTLLQVDAQLHGHIIYLCKVWRWKHQQHQGPMLKKLFTVVTYDFS
jgi:hypothetical protein